MAKNDEVAHSFQSLMGAHGGQVADPVIEARIWMCWSPLTSSRLRSGRWVGW